MITVFKFLTKNNQNSYIEPENRLSIYENMN